MRNSGFQRHDKVIPLRGLPLTLIELAQQRGCDLHRLLRGTRLFAEDLALADVHISAAQWLQLAANAERLCDSEDLPFQLGHRALCHCDPALDGLFNSCANLAQLLRQIARYHPLLQPLVYIDMRRGSRQIMLLCRTDAKGRTAMFLITALHSWLFQLLQRQWGRDYPLSAEFAWPQPPADHQYREYFGQHIRFDRWQSGILIAAADLYRPFAQGDPQLFRRCAARCRQLLPNCRGRHSLLMQTRRLLYRHLHEPLHLDRAAAHFGISTTTFKRRLRQEDSSFQYLQDQVRREAALFLLRHEGWKNHQLADYLHFTDANNFRRAFKRWTGTLPSQWRELQD